MDAHALVNLPPLMRLTSGKPEVVVGIIDGPVALELDHFTGIRTRETLLQNGQCARNNTIACAHGTLVTGVLFANRASSLPGICPGCTVLIEPIFSDAEGETPLASQAELAGAIVRAIEAGVKVLNISAALTHQTSQSERRLIDALNLAAARGVIVVAAAGNQRAMGSSAITRHPWVIPVAACGAKGEPTESSNLGASIGRRGLLAPGVEVAAFGSDNRPRSFGGTSAAAPFVTGTIALLCSLFPRVPAAHVLRAVTRDGLRKTVIPPLLDAWRAYKLLAG